MTCADSCTQRFRDREECYTKFIVHQKKTGEAPIGGGKKKKGKSEEA